MEGYPTSSAVVEAIRVLEQALLREYGTDYAYSISGGGHRLATDNYTDGKILPKVWLSEPKHAPKIRVR